MSSVIEYFTNNLKNGGALLGRGAVDFLKSHLRKKMDQDDKSLSLGGPYGQIGYEWMFRILKEKYKERPAEAIKRLTNAIRRYEPGVLPGARRSCTRPRMSVEMDIKETRWFTEFRKRFTP